MKKIIALTLVLLVLAGCGASGVKTGLGSVSTASATEATADKNAKVQANVTMCAASFDANGKILSVTFDAVQPKMEITAEGKAPEASGEFDSKKEKKDEYGMRPASAIGKEWFEQAAALEEWMTGKNVNDVLNMKTKAANEEHPCVPDEADLASTCTMDVEDFLAALQEAYELAK
ncbi:MAG: hypothetical protein PHD67_08575 [Oscillospiraceae bacterium]|nr:hypothetical protein [Oscillospiraceae bacterium]